MRMRNKPWALDFLSEQPRVHFDPCDYKGNWLKKTGFSKLCVEIGSGKGDYASAMAKLQPDVLWIAIEKDKNVSAVANKKIATLEIMNLHWIVGDAVNLENWFAEGEIDVIHLNFSDPWPKKHHTKRRLTSEGFIERMLKCSNETLEIKFKTDNVKLFEYTMIMWENYPLQLTEFSVDYRREAHPEDAITEYEQHFMDLNQVIYRAVWRKKPC